MRSRESCRRRAPILAGLLLGSFRLAGLLGRGAMLSALSVLVAYADLVGGGASVNRATLMASIYFAGRAIDQRGPPVNAFAFVAATLVAVDPMAAMDPAFLLTCGATLAILVIAPAFAGRPSSPAAYRLLAALFTASLAAEAGVLPIGALFFSRVTFAGLGLNFLAIPLMSVAQVAGMLVIPAAAISARLAERIGWLAHVGADGLVRSSALVRFTPMLTWRVAPPAGWVVVAYYAGAAVAWIAWTRGREPLHVDTRRRVAPQVNRRLLARLGVALCAFAFIWMIAEPWTLLRAGGDGRLHVTFIDVGQGDAAFVQFPGGHTLVVDAGGLPGSPSFDIGDRVVAPVLRQAGVRRLQRVVLTHGDPDHIGGAGSVIREFRPSEVWEGVPVPPFVPLQQLQEVARHAGARWTHVSAGDGRSIDGVTMAVRHPPDADWERQRVRNDDSIVLELLWHEVSIVLTGDIGRAVESRIAGTFDGVPIRILKVPHHGSLTSSSVEFIRALAPRIAVVSAGRANTFGHPAPDVLDRYRAAGAEMFRTDQDGAVTVATDGHRVEVQTHTGKRFVVR